jgi:Protein of unknown function (DUF4231)
MREQVPSSRASRADQYFEQDLRNQLLWYDARATAYKRNAQGLAFLVIAAGSITTFVQVFGQAPWVSIITAGLGALVVFAEGWQRIARYNETWANYRSAAERMKREKRLFVSGTGPYRNLNDEDAYLQFVENVEAIMGEEQQLFWRNRRSEASGQSSTADVISALPQKPKS